MSEQTPKTVAARLFKIQSDKHRESILKILYIAIGSWLVQFIIGVYFIGGAVQKVDITYEQLNLQKTIQRENTVNTTMQMQMIGSMQELLTEYIAASKEDREKIWVEIEKMQNKISDELFGGKDVFRGAGNKPSGYTNGRLTSSGKY